MTRGKPNSQQILRAVQVLLQRNSSKQAKIGAVLALLAAAWVFFKGEAPNISPNTTPNTGELVAQVQKVADGDTVTLRDAQHQTHRVRLAFIDAPEKKQPYGEAARQNLAKIVLNQQVKVKIIERDHYGRIVGQIQAQGLDVNYQMIQSGLAWHYTQYSKAQNRSEFDAYSAAQQEAQVQRLGLWAQGKNAQAPWEFRKAQRQSN